MWKCANCGNTSEDVLDVCWSCQSPRAATQSEPTATSQPRFCPHCTRLIPAGEAQCPYCTALPASSEQVAEPQRKTRTRDEKLVWLQSALRMLAWLKIAASAVNMYEILAIGPGTPAVRELLPSNYAALTSVLYDAAYTWVILMVVAELIGLFMAIEVNTRRSGEGKNVGS